MCRASARPEVGAFEAIRCADVLPFWIVSGQPGFRFEDSESRHCVRALEFETVLVRKCVAGESPWGCSSATRDECRSRGRCAVVHGR